MNDLDQYLKREYNDPDYRLYQIRTEGRASVFAHLVRWMASWKARPTAQPLPQGEVLLGRAVVRRWLVGAGGPNLHCRGGSLWLTKTGDSRDFILVAGQSRRLEPGVWVIQALQPARFHIPTPVNEEAPHGQTRLLPAF